MVLPPQQPNQVSVSDLGLQFLPRVGTRVLSGAANIPGVCETRIDRFLFNFQQLQTLNSIPLTLVFPPGNHVVMPLWSVWHITRGTDVFSGTITPSYICGSLTGLAGAPPAFDGSVSIVQLGDDIESMEGKDYVAGLAVGEPLQLTSDGDQTGGTNTLLSLFLTYLMVNLG